MRILNNCKIDQQENLVGLESNKISVLTQKINRLLFSTIYIVFFFYKCLNDSKGKLARISKHHWMSLHSFYCHIFETNSRLMFSLFLIRNCSSVSITMPMLFVNVSIKISLNSVGTYRSDRMNLSYLVNNLCPIAGGRVKPMSYNSVDLL